MEFHQKMLHDTKNSSALGWVSIGAEMKWNGDMELILNGTSLKNWLENKSFDSLEKVLWIYGPKMQTNSAKRRVDIIIVIIIFYQINDKKLILSALSNQEQDKWH